MTLQQLEYIRAVDKYGHFGKAAEACGVTQPTLSLMIKKLEEELDVRIFDRDSYPIVATEMGRKVIDKAGIVLYNLGQITEITRSEKDLDSGEIKIAMTSTIAPILIPGMFKYIGKKYPAVQPIIQERFSETIISMLKKAEIDMGILVSSVNDPELLEIPLYHEKFLAYVSPEHPLYRKDALDSTKILDHPLWIIKNGLRRFDRSMLEKGERFDYDKMYEGGRAGTLIHIVNELGGFTIIPELHKKLILYSLQPNLRPIVNPVISRKVSLYIRKDYIHEHLLNIIIEAIRFTIPLENLDKLVREGRLVL